MPAAQHREPWTGMSASPPAGASGAGAAPSPLANRTISPHCRTGSPRGDPTPKGPLAVWADGTEPIRDVVCPDCRIPWRSPRPHCQAGSMHGVDGLDPAICPHAMVPERGHCVWLSWSAVAEADTALFEGAIWCNPRTRRLRVGLDRKRETADRVLRRSHPGNMRTMPLGVCRWHFCGWINDSTARQA